MKKWDASDKAICEHPGVFVMGGLAGLALGVFVLVFILQMD